MYKILIIADHRLNRAPSQRYRFEQYLSFFQKNGLAQNVETDFLRFRTGLFEKNKIRFINLRGRKTSVLVKSERTSGYKDNEPVKFLSHMEPGVRVFLDRFLDPVLSISIRIGVSNLNGEPFKTKTALSRRKKATRGWNNWHWLSRHLAFLHWMTDGKSLTLLKTESGNLTIGCRFKEIRLDRGIDESQIQIMKTTRST